MSTEFTETVNDKKTYWSAFVQVWNDGITSASYLVISYGHKDIPHEPEGLQTQARRPARCGNNQLTAGNGGGRENVTR